MTTHGWERDRQRDGNRCGDTRERESATVC
jgi:hypothetical protein